VLKFHAIQIDKGVEENTVTAFLLDGVKIKGKFHPVTGRGGT
jgi:hypothetical protein